MPFKTLIGALAACVLVIGLVRATEVVRQMQPSAVQVVSSVNPGIPGSTLGAHQPLAPALPADQASASMTWMSALTPTIYLPYISAPQSRIGPVVKLAETVGKYEKFQVTFPITTTAANPYLPYELGAPSESGVSVDMLVTDPDGKTVTVPCFYYQPVDENLSPVGAPDWRCRFAPGSAGNWHYRVRMIDSNGVSESAPDSFSVTPSNRHGFVHVSSTDPSTFEFSDGTSFAFPLLNVEQGSPLGSLEKIRTSIPEWGQSGVRFVRWFPTGEGANYYVIPFGDDIRSSWGFGSAETVAEADPTTGRLFTFKPYYYTSQTVRAVPGAHYRLSFRAKVSGDKVFRPHAGRDWIEIRASDWQDYSIETTGESSALAVRLADGYSESDGAQGMIRVHSIRLQRDETGNGDWGPNLLARGDPDTHQYIDQVGAARLDEIMQLSEQYGVYHKLTLFHKNDANMGRLAPNGSVTTTWDINNFYGAEGDAVRRYEKAFARYFVARWSYSTALHSIELANENMLTQNSYDAAFSILGHVRSISPRPILLSNSFWGYFVSDFWTDPTRGHLMDYADKHWYARPGSTNPEMVSTVAYDSAANVRECQRRFGEYQAQYNLSKPIVRGETGVWKSDSTDKMDLGSGAFTYYHKQLWAQMGDQCGGEWYTSFLDEQDLWSMYGVYERFLQGEPLSSGHYIPVGTDVGTITITNMSGHVRAWGKVDLRGRGILWIDNADDTWKAVADGRPGAPASATLTLGGLSNGTYDIQWHNTMNGTVITDTHIISDGRLVLSVSDLQHDVAMKWSKK